MLAVLPAEASHMACLRLQLNAPAAYVDGNVVSQYKGAMAEHVAQKVMRPEGQANGSGGAVVVWACAGGRKSLRM